MGVAGVGGGGWGVERVERGKRVGCSGVGWGGEALLDSHFRTFLFSHSVISATFFCFFLSHQFLHFSFFLSFNLKKKKKEEEKKEDVFRLFFRNSILSAPERCTIPSLQLPSLKQGHVSEPRFSRARHD